MSVMSTHLYPLGGSHCVQMSKAWLPDVTQKSQGCSQVPLSRCLTGASPPVLLAGTGPLQSVVEQMRQVSRQSSRPGAIGEVGSIQNPCTVRRVPGVIAVSPGQHVRHGREEVVEGDADDHVVVDADVRGHHHHAIAHACGKAQ